MVAHDPVNTTQDNVSDNYHSLAEERDDFELTDAASDEWLWINNVLLITWDYHFDNPKRIDIDFIFLPDIE